MRIREARRDDADSIAAIYNHYIANSVVTFETEPKSSDSMAARIKDTAAESLPWLVVEVDDEVAGYAYASRWNGRCAYRYSVESTIYLHPDKQGRGIGTSLYPELLQRLQACSMHVVIAGISLPNPGSIALHEKLGFGKIGAFTEVGFKFGRWIDVGYWQLTL